MPQHEATKMQTYRGRIKAALHRNESSPARTPLSRRMDESQRPALAGNATQTIRSGHVSLRSSKNAMLDKLYTLATKDKLIITATSRQV